MEDQIIVCVPGTWESRSEFVTSIVASTKGEFIFAGTILAHPSGNDHVELEFFDAHEQMAEAFEYGGQGKLSEVTLNRIAECKSVAYLHFPFDIISQKERINRFTEVLSRSGGIAAKLETSGIAHDWEQWFGLLRSDNPFDTYRGSVVLVGDDQFFYSCGMHNFGLPDAQISNRFDPGEGADLLNRFNYWQIVEKPVLEPGHTFSLTETSPHFQLELLEDPRHGDDNTFRNPNGIWELRTN